MSSGDLSLVVIIAMILGCCSAPGIIKQVGDQAVNYAIASRECPEAK